MQKRYLSCNTRGSLSITAATFCREQNRYSHYKKQRHIYMHDKDTPTSAQQHLLRDYYRKLSHWKLLNCIGKCPEYSGKHPQLKTLPKRIFYSSALATLIFKAFLQEKFWRKCRVDCRCNIACLFTHKVGKKKRVEKQKKGFHKTYQSCFTICNKISRRQLGILYKMFLEERGIIVGQKSDIV